ncbi:3-hydroxyacyl-CoA dehydrogenase NAD-binding domain-containing protein [Streptomyces sp. NPDC008001]|uniref:mycothiol-dependent nitroreductase Rv2466c family protein n=1 Tax=Streptomyces sp. NPDC008001 TaxID=3364804 RepID=UPI0036E12054
MSSAVQPSEDAVRPPGERNVVAVIGAGTIGLGWIALFLSRGLRVRVNSRRPDAERVVREGLAVFAPTLPGGAADVDALMQRVEFEPDVARAVRGAAVVQENAPDDLALKQELFRTVERAAPAEALLLSSTSKLLPDDMGALMSEPGRVVVGHPFNPPHVVPLVEVVGGRHAPAGLIDEVTAFYRAVGKVPVVVRKPVPRFVANRLQSALLKESVHLVQEGVVTMAELDAVVTHSIGLRWAVVGPFEAFHLGGGEGGLRRWLGGTAPALERAWRATAVPALTPEAVEALGAEADRTFGTDYAALSRARDEKQNAVLDALARVDAREAPEARSDRAPESHREDENMEPQPQQPPQAESHAVDFWFDPLCPFAWIASRWITEVAGRAPVTVRWHVMSLALLNSGKDMPEARRTMLDLYWGPVRVLAAARAAHGDAVTGPLYTAMGSRFHGPGGIFEPVRTAPAEEFRAAMIEGLGKTRPDIEAALAETGLPAELIDAMDDDRWDAELRASRDRVPSDGLGQDLIGVPTISVDGGAGQFGPVLSEIPRGERAVRLWEAFRTLAGDPAFFELKQSTGRTEPLTHDSLTH